MSLVGHLKNFLKLETASGQLLIIAAIMAMIVNNSPLSEWYDKLLQVPVAIQVSSFIIAKPLLLWINDGLMAIFFFLIGLEVKREVLGGQLSSFRAIALPAMAAIGGMAAPALIYTYINQGNDIALNGWAIPSATDIAFALGILALLGKRVPPALKVFLLTLAIIDDMGAVVIIAIFYSGDLSTLSLVTAAIALVMLAIINRSGVISLGPYIIIGIILWASVLKSGVHATLAGILLAFFIPYRIKQQGEKNIPPLIRAEHALHPWVSFAVLPIFAFANAGVSLEGMSIDRLLDPIPLGIAAGLLLGNPVGIMSMSWIAVRVGIASLPQGVTWPMMFGVSIICGIGFTMSLFIGGLAFQHTGVDHTINDRIGILIGSILAATIGFFTLRSILDRSAPKP